MLNLNDLPAGQERAYIDKLIASGMVRVTKCPDGEYDARAHGLRGKRGGMSPRHLDPRKLGLTREELEAQEREALIPAPKAKGTPKSGKASRKIRRVA